MDSSTDRVVYTAEELLSDPPCSTPLIAGGVLCHGGFGSEGEYRSPRTLHRNPAVLAWQAQLTAAGHALIDIDDALLPPQYPSVAQAKLLLERGHREPIVRALTVISIVEGFGAIIRDVRVPDLASSFVESIEGTALAHLERGLFEAHARDEAGYRDQGGHKQMWEAARDLALEHPKVPSDVFMRLMGNRGQARAGDPLFPQLDKSLYRMLTMMTQVYAIEMFAKRTFEWGIALLSDDRVSAAPKAAGDMVRFIQSDEAPHVQYLRTALSEVRARTLRGVDGSAIAGRTVVDVMLHAMLVRSIDARPREQRGETRGYLERAVSQGEANASLLEEFDALAPSFAPPSKTGFEPVAV